ncbi:MAG: hypothetical protein QNJ44_22525 [Rhodobacter sp.]|nr:hypothetical protein [Rhodobacter sp.]
MTKREIITVPWSLFGMTEVDWDIDFREQGALENIAGGTQVVYSAFPRWIGSPSLVLNRAEILAWRAHRWHAGGLRGVFRIFMKDPAAVNLRAIAGADAYIEPGVPFSTGAVFATGEGLQYSPTVETVGAAAKGATEMVIDPATAEFPIVPGMIVSHDDWPIGITSVTTEGSYQRLTFRPEGLRGAIPDQGRISLLPTGLFEASTAGMGNPAYGLDRVSRPRLQLREWINRP